MRGRHSSGGRKLVVCDAIPAVPGEVLLIPWGYVESISGDFLVDGAGADSILAAFRSHGIKLVVDWEHQSLGGEAYSSPDGTAPAAGWIASLRTVPGKGIYGTVEWTRRAAERIAAKEYLYLSAVIVAEKDTKRAVELHSIALTNVPAIRGFPSLVNKRIANEQEKTMDAILTRLASVITALQAVEGVPEDIVGALQQILEDARALVEEKAGGEPEAVAGKDSRVIQENRRLRARLDGQEFEAMMTAHRGKIPPSQLGAFRSWWAFDPQAAETFLTNSPMLVHTRGQAVDQPGSGPSMSNRHAVIVRAKSDFEAEKTKGKVICSRRAFVNLALRDASLPKLTDDEIRQHNIQVEPLVV